MAVGHVINDFHVVYHTFQPTVRPPLHRPPSSSFLFVPPLSPSVASPHLRSQIPMQFAAELNKKTAFLVLRIKYAKYIELSATWALVGTKDFKAKVQSAMEADGFVYDAKEVERIRNNIKKRDSHRKVTSAKNPNSRSAKLIALQASVIDMGPQTEMKIPIISGRVQKPRAQQPRRKRYVSDSESEDESSVVTSSASASVEYANGVLPIDDAHTSVLNPVDNADPQRSFEDEFQALCDSQPVDLDFEWPLDVNPFNNFTGVFDEDFPSTVDAGLESDQVLNESRAEDSELLLDDAVLDGELLKTISESDPETILASISGTIDWE
jgi:hypothetical protein